MFQIKEVVKTSGGDERRTGWDTCLGFIVTNLETDSRAVVRFSNKRGTARHGHRRRIRQSVIFKGLILLILCVKAK
jgi:hypothetical protein